MISDRREEPPLLVLTWTQALGVERREGQSREQRTSRIGMPVGGHTSSGSMVERDALIGLRDGECAWALDDGPIPRIVPLARRQPHGGVAVVHATSRPVGMDGGVLGRHAVEPARDSGPQETRILSGPEKYFLCQ